MKKKILFFIIGMVLCIVPPVIATIQYFPVWRESPQASVSGVSVIMLVCCLVPLWKYIKAFFKSPSAWKLWVIVFVLCLFTRSIVNEVFYISAIGVPSSIAGCVMFRISKNCGKKDGGENE